MPTTKKKQKDKRHRVNTGDIVYFHSPNPHCSGTIGEIIQVLDRKRVIAKAVAPGDEDFIGTEVVLHTAQPKGTLPSGSPTHFYRHYITRVAFRAKPKPPSPVKKKPKILSEATVITSQDQLLEHLRSDSKDKVVLQIPHDDETSSPQAMEA